MQLKSITLEEVLQENGLSYVDWFKTDSQGTDLRLFSVLPPEMISGVKVAEFEPGIIDAYRGEDKFYDLLKWMNGKDFFLDELICEPVYRIRPETVEKYGLSNKVWRYAKKTPGWVNLTFLNTGANWEKWTLRDALFFQVCCLVHRQYGMVLEFADSFKKRFPDEKFFAVMEKYARKKLKQTPLRLLGNAVLRKLAVLLNSF